MCSTNTPFQNKLSEVLYEDTTKLGMSFSIDDSLKEIVDSLKLNEGDLLMEVSWIWCEIKHNIVTVQA